MTDFDTFPLEAEAQEFWEICGGPGFRRAKKEKTKAAYIAERRKGVSKETIFEGMKAFKRAHCDVAYQYLPHSYNWLKDGQYEDCLGVEIEPRHLSPVEQEEVRQRAIELVQARKNAANGR